MIKVNPFNPFVPIETKLRMFKLETPRREPLHPCNCCGRPVPLKELDNHYNQGACNSCMINEFGKGE